MNNSIELFLKNTLNTVLKEIELHNQGQATSLPINVLNNVKVELELMVKFMSPKEYTPGYARFVLDFPDESELVNKLIEASNLYKKIKK